MNYLSHNPSRNAGSDLLDSTALRDRTPRGSEGLLSDDLVGLTSEH
jgi:hypothetical protein